MFLRRLTAAALAVTAGLATVALSSPAHAEEALPDIRTAIAFSQETGKVGDTLTVTVTVSNNGTGKAEGVAVRREWEEALAWTSPALADAAPFDLAAGESKVLTRTGVIPQAAYADGYVHVLYFFAAANKDSNSSDNVAGRSIRVPGQVGDHTVRVVDAGSSGGVAGAVVEFTELTQSPGNFSARVTSNAAGNAQVKGVQVGRYRLKVTPPAGWRAASPAQAQVSITAKPGSFTFELERTGEPTEQPEQPASPAPSTPAGEAPSATAGPTASASASGEAPGDAPGEAPGAGGGEGDGGLPITGANTTTIVVAGAGLLIAGAVAFLLTRQRRTRFTSSH